MGVWPQFRSPLVWDVFAVSTYATVSLLFWYQGLLPDLASMRDRARHRWAQLAYGVLALGWRGAARHWHRHQRGYLLLAALAIPPYFVAGAILSGFSMLATLVLPLRRAFSLHDLVTQRHVENMAKMMLVTGLLVGYGYAIEHVGAWWTGEHLERFMIANRWQGPYAPFMVSLVACNVLCPALFAFGRVRRSVIAVWVLSQAINVGMWAERYVIVVTSLHRDFLPSSWGTYSGTLWDWATLLGSIGLFLSLLFLFVRVLPAISMAEMRELAGGKEGSA